MTTTTAQAFWLRAPGCGEIRPVGLPEPGPDDVVVRTVRSGVSRGTETLVFRGGVPPGSSAADAGAVPGGRLPGPVKYGYLNVGAVEQGPPELRGRTVFCLYPHQTAYVVPAGAVIGRAGGRPTRPCRARGHRRDRGQRAVGRRPARRRPGRGRRRRDGRLLRRTTAAAGFRPCRSRSWTSTPAGRTSRPPSASTSRFRTTPPAAATWSCTRARRRPGSSARSTCSHPRHRHRPQLVRRHGGSALAGRRVPRGPPRHPLEPGRHALPGPRRAPHDGRPPGARARPAARPRLRRAPHRRVALRRAARRDGPAGRGSLPALCHTITYGEG